MQITILTAGSRGDVEPLLGLAGALRELGHNPTVVGSPDFAELAASYGTEFEPFGPPLPSYADNPELVDLVESGNMLRFMAYAARSRKRILPQIIGDIWRAARHSEAVLYKGPTALYGYNVAEKLGVPCADLQFFPVTPTREFPTFLLGDGSTRGALLDRAGWWSTDQMIWRSMQRPGVNRQRREILGLPPLRTNARVLQDRQGMPLYYAYSPLVLPRPADWHPRIQVTGYLPTHAPVGWEPPADLARFLDAGEPPVSFGLGSVPVANPSRLVDAYLEALERTGRRGLLIGGWANLGRDRDLPDHVLQIDSAPYDWLFPRLAAAVHHGGAGTTAASLRAGIPTVITPVAADQHAWGRRVADLGVGPEPIRIKKVDADRLTAAIARATTDEALRERSADLGARLRQEDGIGRAAELFTEYLRTAPARMAR
ncbi:UDP:flavonoid glycosyltransferase YjiC, YdhE family [Promicromonospora umidemergens]|uniref:Glycosyltransferase n=1 Tax=Promicromonospora umidemergens TaxID=629679 RepID=A0ABP8XCE8_9MICO|nr:glycosyltransferase [Promicromonospora umidemergens]MCP2283033.1 UDP:flavonoid glycosyltransferase YjiC, YdhE family [Promicromonospora umidemergens]